MWNVKDPQTKGSTMNIFKMFFTILFDQRAEEPGAGAGAGEGAAGAGDGGAGQGEAPAEGGQGAAPGAEGGQEGAGQGDGGEGAAPVYGKYKTPDELWKAHQDLTNKTSQTEANAARLRKTLESSGIKVVQGEDGQMMLVPVENKPERKKKFSDEQKKKMALYFGDDPEKGVESAGGFLQLLQPFIEDLLEDQFYNREQEFNQRNTQVSKFRQEQQDAQGDMLHMFPSLKYGTDENPNAEFNQAFYDRATEIYKAQYSKDPRGELLAAIKAARELGITSNAIKQAQAQGVKLGQAGKKILGPVGGGQGKAGGSGKVLTKAEYMALSPDKREEHDRAALQVQK